MEDRKYNLLSSLVGTVIGAITGAVIAYALVSSADYIISMEDNSDLEFNSNFSEIRYVDIYNEHFFHPYKSNILLEATFLNGTPLSPELEIDFNPASLIRVPGRSSMKVNGTNVKDGDYKIKIIAMGANGNERSCPYRLIIKAKNNLIL